MHYSLGTEQVYLYWIRFFIRWHGRNGQMQRPRNMSAQGIEAFLTMLATERKVSASTTMIYTHVLKAAARGSTSPLDQLAA